MALQLLAILVVTVLIIHEYEYQRFEEAAGQVVVKFGHLSLESKAQDFPLYC